MNDEDRGWNAALCAVAERLERDAADATSGWHGAAATSGWHGAAATSGWHGAARDGDREAMLIGCAVAGKLRELTDTIEAMKRPNGGEA